ncbi:unnamed protein product [Heligmosomoides polygyrus]|uniref:glutathione transferase n=1 Tax=Heligmosomoides polygyrus TaxID=6339 RepID=A0A183FGG6_HELPZ|nr:unnamed protein product [Heligmosomoides polygyrus]
MTEQRHFYTLHYFNIRGRGEPIRLIFVYFDVKFEDHRIANDDWPKFKPGAPMGQVPYLDVDGGKLVLCQMQSICRYLAKSLRPNDYFAGATKSDSAKCDMYVEAFMNLFSLGVERLYEDDPVIRMKKEEIFMKQYPVRLRVLEDHLKSNGGRNFVGKTVLWCDLVALCVLSMLEEGLPELMEDFPIMHSYYTSMRELPTIKDYIGRAWPPASAVSKKQADGEES